MMMEKLLSHLTLTSGDLRASPRSEVADDVVRVARSMLAGEAVAGWTVRLVHPMPAGTAAYDLLHDGRRVVACYLGIEPAPSKEMWQQLQRSFANLPLPPASEPPTPWLAVMLVPDPAVMRDPLAFADVLGEAGDLERVVAWAIIDGPGS